MGYSEIKQELFQAGSALIGHSTNQEILKKVTSGERSFRVPKKVLRSQRRRVKIGLVDYNGVIDSNTLARSRAILIF